MNYYKRYEEELKLKGYAQRSIQSYTRALRQLQNYCHKPLEEITEEELREYKIIRTFTLSSPQADFVKTAAPGPPPKANAWFMSSRSPGFSEAR